MFLEDGLEEWSCRVVWLFLIFLDSSGNSLKQCKQNMALAIKQTVKVRLYELCITGLEFGVAGDAAILKPNECH